MSKAVKTAKRAGIGRRVPPADPYFEAAAKAVSAEVKRRGVTDAQIAEALKEARKETVAKWKREGKI